MSDQGSESPSEPTRGASKERESGKSTERTHRRRAREVAMQALFQLDLNPTMSDDAVRAFIADELKFRELEEFCVSLVSGVRTNRESIDETIGRAAQNWSIARMSPVDRNVLRLATYEMRFAADQAPPKVAINEAIEICKRFSTEKSTRFVNGILNRLLEEREQGTGNREQ